MKKFVLGLIVGVVFMVSGQAIAETASKVGKRVQAEYDVVVDGKTLPAKAIAIDGQTLTPNRALADATGYNIKFEDNKVIFTSPQPEGQEKVIIQDQINMVDGDIMGIEQLLRLAEGQLLTGIDNEEVKRNTEKQVADYKKQLEELQAKKAELEAQLEALE